MSSLKRKLRRAARILARPWEDRPETAPMFNVGTGGTLTVNVGGGAQLPPEHGVLPMKISDGRLIYCAEMSGGQDGLHDSDWSTRDAPMRLLLVVREPDGQERRVEYRRHHG